MSNESVQLAFVPGMQSSAKSWSRFIPGGVSIVPVEWFPSLADDPNAPGCNFGGPGDVIEVAVLRLLTVSLRLSAADCSWAIAGHSAGGSVAYRCLDLLCALVSDPNYAETISRESKSWLPQFEAQILGELLCELSSRPLNLPVAVVSLEGCLLPCDVEDWAEDWGSRLEPPEDAGIDDTSTNGNWTWPMLRACSGSLHVRCKLEEPARHLASIKQWLELPSSPGLVYVAAEWSSMRNAIVFPALKNIAAACRCSHKLRLEEVPRAGHTFKQAPEALMTLLRDILLGRVSPLVHHLSDVDQNAREHRHPRSRSPR